jgi:hypothetical protein
MTSAGRLYAVLTAVVVFFLSWATVAAHPWRKTGVDPRLIALAQRRTELRHESLRVRRVLDRRWVTYRVALARRQRLNARLAAQARAAQQVVTVSRPTQFVAGTPQLASVGSAAPAPVSAPPPVVAVAPATATHTS